MLGELYDKRSAWVLVGRLSHWCQPTWYSFFPSSCLKDPRWFRATTCSVSKKSQLTDSLAVGNIKNWLLAEGTYIMTLSGAAGNDYGVQNLHTWPHKSFTCYMRKLKVYLNTVPSKETIFTQDASNKAQICGHINLKILYERGFVFFSKFLLLSNCKLFLLDPSGSIYLRSSCPCSQLHCSVSQLVLKYNILFVT